MGTFKEVEVELGNRGKVLAQVSYDLVKGYAVRHLPEIESMPPMTGVQTAFGILWYGDLKPSLILSSQDRVKIAIRCLMPSYRKAVMYGCNFGFMLNGATWSHNDEVDGEWVVLLNTEHPDDPKLNGCYKPTWQ